MVNFGQLLNVFFVASIAYLGYRDRLYREAFKALGVYDMPNLAREIKSLKV